MDTTPRHADIIDSVSTQAELAQQLLELLRGEYQALAHLDGEQLQGYVTQKQHLVDALEALHFEFQGLARDAGYPVQGKADMEHLVEALDPRQTEGLNAAWQVLSATLANCQNQNEINGMVIALGHQSLQNVLAALQGLPPGSVFYGRNGQTNMGSAHNVLAKV